MPDLQRTRPSNKYLLKTAIFLVLFGGFGSWGLYDALIKYPKAGAEYADFALANYLKTAEKSGRLYGSAVPDPKGALEQLNAGIGPTNDVERARKAWLESLQIIGKLDPAHTSGFDEGEKLKELSARWQSTTPPSPLSRFDFASQWVFVLVGYGLSAWILVILLRVMVTAYKWDPQTKTLFLPGKVPVTAGDLVELDKTQWHKFIVFLRLVETHPMGGRPIRLDLYRHDPLEAWVTELEAIRFPDLREPDAKPEGPDEPPEAPDPDASEPASA